MDRFLQKIFISFFFLGNSFLFSVEDRIYPESFEGGVGPWFTGPLLAPAFAIVPPGQVNVQPYLFAFAITGEYDDKGKVKKEPTYWNNFSQTSIEVGALSFLDVQINPLFYWNYSQGSGHWAFGDFPLQINIQIYSSENDCCIPNIKLSIAETFPTGKYRNLNPNDHGTQIGGIGSWETDFILVLGNIHHLIASSYLQWRFFIDYALFSSTHLLGFNSFGGGYGTDAHLTPGQSLILDLGLELSLTREWVLALDLASQWIAKDHYRGIAGVLENGEKAPLGNPFRTQLSLAPAIEYNFNANLGIIAGGWFTVCGRNSNQFVSGSLSVNYLY